MLSIVIGHHPMVKRPQKPPIKPAVPGMAVNHTISMSQERLIGRIVVEWSKLEGAMDDLIWHFFDLPMEFGRVITTKMDATTKIATLRTLNTLVFQTPLQESLKEILDMIDILREDRNLIVHGTWGRSVPEGTPFVLSLRIKDTPSTVVSVTFPAERMRAIYLNIVSLKWKVVEFHAEAQSSHHGVRAQFPPS
jgi:hypothetical protein